MHRLSQFLRGWVGQFLLEHAPLGAEKDVFGRYLLLIKLRNFDPNRRYRNEASMLGVLYPYAHIVPYAIGKQCSYIIYNTLWRGLAELLISLGKGNAKAR
ncbi:MAG: hypothetical protein IKU79_00500 [Bacteroidaceae bacterium]|nr:hypothetical protein [Bacteroidaceae bacterium]